MSHKKVYTFEANLVFIEFKSLAYLSHTIGLKIQFAVEFGHENRTWIQRKTFKLFCTQLTKKVLLLESVSALVEIDGLMNARQVWHLDLCVTFGV